MRQHFRNVEYPRMVSKTIVIEKIEKKKKLEEYCAVEKAIRMTCVEGMEELVFYSSGDGSGIWVEHGIFEFA